MLEWGGLDLQFWREVSTWPHGAVVVVIPGGAGHEREITASFHDAEGDPLFDWEDYISDYLVGLFTEALPEGWRVDDRGTRLELHPSGRTYGGFDASDVVAVMRAATELGFDYEVRDFRR